MFLAPCVSAYSSSCYLDSLLLSALWHSLVTFVSGKRESVYEEIGFCHRGLQSVLCHCTHLIILYWNLLMTFRRFSLCWCICGFTFSKSFLRLGIHDQIMGSFVLADLCSNSWTVSLWSSFISSAKNHSDRNDSSYLKETLGNDLIRQGGKTLFTSPYLSLLINISNWKCQRCFLYGSTPFSWIYFS